MAQAYRGIGETLVTVGALSGAPEDFGPTAPNTKNKIEQLIADTTGLQVNLLYALGAGVAAYIAYRLYYDV